MITFHKLTLAQYDKMVGLSGQMIDGLYFITDAGVIKLHNEGGSVTTFGTSVKMVDEFPDANNVQPYCIYTQRDTKEQKIWTGSEWEVLSYPVINQITSGVALSATIEGQPVVTIPDTYAVYNFVNDKVAAAELGVQVKLHTPVQTLEALQNLSLDDVEDKCMILVQNAGLYRYDVQSRASDDPDTDAVVVPKEVQDSVPEGDSIDFHPGRWIKMFSNMSYVSGDGVIISANASDLIHKINNVVSLNVNEEQFEFVDGKLTFKSDADIVSSKVDKVFARPDEIPIWRNDGNQDASGYKFNRTENLTTSNTTISPDSVISTFVHEITDKKLDDVAANSDGKIIVGKGNDGKVDASAYDIGKDNDNYHGHYQTLPQNKVATERAVKWYVDRSLSFNKDELLPEVIGGIPPNELGD